MINFILDLIIMVSLGTLLYFIVRTLPRVDDSNFDSSELKTHWLVGYIEKADNKFQAFSEKFLRRCKIITLKVDNYLGGKLSNFRKDNDRNSVDEFEFGEKEVENVGEDIKEVIIIEEEEDIEN